MGKELTEQEINDFREDSINDVQHILQELESSIPGLVESLGAVTGVSLGGVASVSALSSLGVSGLSAAGITSGLAAAGSLVGGGMLAGIGVIAAPVAILGVAGYSVFKYQKVKNDTAALQNAIDKISSVLEKLERYSYFFPEEIASIKVIIEKLKMKANLNFS